MAINSLNSKALHFEKIRSSTTKNAMTDRVLVLIWYLVTRSGPLKMLLDSPVMTNISQLSTTLTR